MNFGTGTRTQQVAELKATKSFGRLLLSLYIGRISSVILLFKMHIVDSDLYCILLHCFGVCHCF